MTTKEDIMKMIEENRNKTVYVENILINARCIWKDKANFNVYAVLDKAVRSLVDMIRGDEKIHWSVDIRFSPYVTPVTGDRMLITAEICSHDQQALDKIKFFTDRIGIVIYPDGRYTLTSEEGLNHYKDSNEYIVMNDHIYKKSDIQ